MANKGLYGSSVLINDYTDANATRAEVAAAAALVSETNAAASESAAAGSASAANIDALATAADLVLTDADTVATAADRVQTGLDKIATAADRVQTGLDEVATNADALATAADRVQTGLDKTGTAADLVQTNLDQISCAADAASTAADVTTTNANAASTAADVISTAANAAATAADKIATNADAAATALDKIATNADAAATAADLFQTNLDQIATTADAAATALDKIATNADAAATAADKIATNADAASTAADVLLTAADVVSTAADVVTVTNIYDDFDDRYLGPKASDPALDNDGGALVAGTLYFNTTAGEMRVYDGAVWEAAYIPASSYLAVTDIGVTVQGYSAVLDATTASFLVADESKLDAIEAGAEVNNISDINATDLTDTGDTTLHIHSADRARANHTGTQLASTISDFGTAVGANETSHADVVVDADIGVTVQGYSAVLAATTASFLLADETKLDGIEAGAEVNNISDVNATDLTDAGDSALHYHSADRARANHTGTQLAATISDFGTAVTANETSHTGVLTTTDVDDVAVNGATTAPVSSNWAFDHAALAAAHGATGAVVGTTNTQTLTNKTHTDIILDGSIKEEVAAMPALALDPANGTIQTKTLASSSVFTDSLTDGESMVLHVDDGTAYTITWPTMDWIGGAAPTLPTTGYAVIVLWKEGTSLHGNHVGDLA